MTEQQLVRQVERQRKARKEAEQLLENKSRELYNANQQLKENQAQLEQRVEARTQDLQQALEELAESRDQALQASKMKSEFLANMSHEIRTPLNGIVGTTELLVDMAQNREQLDLFNTLKTSSETLLHLINDILDFSKIEQGKLTLEERNLDLTELCDSVIHLFSSTAKDKRLTLSANYQPSPLPLVKGDPTRIRQILSNLVANALKFTHRGSVTLDVSVDRQNSLITFQVKDTGIGIDVEKQQHLFDAFTQADNSTTRKYGGSGLGLAICAQLAELMNGTILVDSRLDEGSTFTLRVALPILESPSEQVHTCAEEMKLSKHLWVLVVDDNLINRKVGTRLLESMNCSVMLAEGGQEAVDACRNNDFDIVLMDIQMPNMDGVEAMLGIRELDKEPPPIVALTAHALQGDRDRYLAEGFDEYLEKPLKKSRLWTVLSEIAIAEQPASEKHEQNETQHDWQRASLLNTTTLNDFIELMGDEYAALVERFKKDLVNGCQEIVENQDKPELVRKTAHRLRSSAGYLGAERMYGLLQWLEQKFKYATMDERLTTARISLQLAEQTCKALDAAK